MKNIWVFFFLIFWASNCFAAGLEIEYPELPNVAAVTSKTSIPEYFLYIFNLATFIGLGLVLLALTISGVQYLFSIAVPDKRADAKNRAFSAILGLVFLALIYLIVVTINPQLAVFKISGFLETPKFTSSPLINPGVKLFISNDCSETSLSKSKNPLVFSSSDLGNLKNKVSSIKVINDEKIEAYYTGFLYNEINYYGKCQPIHLNIPCDQNIKPYAASMSVFRYDFEPDPEGSVTFYRNSFFDPAGGFYTIPAEEIESGDGVYTLEDLHFVSGNECNVPEEDQTCTEWDLNGKCKEKECPNLAGKNINSIKINGGYSISLIYYAKGIDKPSGPWSFCQGFPLDRDVDKKGPRQIKWEPTRLQSTLPNYVMIYPIKN